MPSPASSLRRASSRQYAAAEPAPAVAGRDTSSTDRRGERCLRNQRTARESAATRLRRRAPSADARPPDRVRQLPVGADQFRLVNSTNMVGGRNHSARPAVAGSSWQA
ncbi:hypothetical protein SANTM175S_00139 [Streptomyces antimycoticus]